MKKVSVVLLISMGFVSSIWAVERTVTRNFDELLEVIYSQWEEYVAYEALQERLWECYNEPLSINKVSREDLRLLCILTDNQLDQLFKHLIKNGPLISIYELQTIPGFDLATIRRLVPFIRIVTVLENYESRSLWHKGLESKSDYGLVRYERTLEKRRGYQYNRKQHKVPYAGSPHKLFTQLSIKRADWALGVSGRKGAGEALTWNPAVQYYGLPNSRFYWLLNNKKGIKTLVIGDYAVGYGQGLILNAGFSMDKSSETIKVIRTNNLGIKPHTSVTTAAFRGVAITWQWQFMELTTYYSNIDLDASVKKTSYLKNVIRSGYYRTQGEIAKRKQINEQVIGGTIIYKDPIQGSELGINALCSQYSLPI